MKRNILDFNFINYTHNRDSHYSDISNDLFNLINHNTNKNEFIELYSYFYNRYRIPPKVTRQAVRQYLARSYLLRKGKFHSKLNLKSIPISLLKYFTLLYSLPFFKKKKKIKHYKLIVDNITSSHELNRFEKLINLFGINNVLCITRDIKIEKDFPKYFFYNKKLFQDIFLKDLLKSIYNEFFVGIWLILKLSIRVKINLFPITLSILHNYLSFKSIFETNKSKYLIQGKHYNTEPIKNYLFKKLGGVVSTTIQKNIIQSDPIFFYIDIDILFALGSENQKRINEYGGRVNTVKPVGSLFMEHAWFNQKHDVEKKFDIAILGINATNAYERLDSYNKFKKDYYSMYKWLAKLSIKRPELKIVLIHHASAGKDEIEKEILSNSNVIVINKNINSYKIAFSSKFAITYGSTMGYELNAHNLPTFFIDPGNRCSFLPDKKDSLIEAMRIESYSDLNILVDKFLKNDGLSDDLKINFDMLCLNSSDVSKRIYQNLINQNI